MARKQYPTTKPYPSYPLTPRSDGRFRKTINGREHLFGRNGDWRQALDEYLSVARPLHANAPVIPPPDRPTRPPTIQQVVNRFLDGRRREVDAKIIELGTWDDYREALTRFLDFVRRDTPATEIRGEHLDRFGKHVLGELKLSASRYHLYRANVRAFLRHAFDAGWLPPFPLGVHFKRIPKRKMRAERKKRVIAPPHLRALIGAATGQLRAMILLALNGGLGNTDCATLLRELVDLDAGMIVEHHRGKTGIDRMVPLWPETVDSILAIWGDRPADPLLFRTKYGNPWVREKMNAKGKVTAKDSIAQAFGDLVDSFCLVTDRAEDRKTFAEFYDGVGFYWLRHIHRTLSDEARDPHAAMRIVGHAFPGMSDVYVEDIAVERLRAVVDHVRQRVFGDQV